MGKAKAKTPPRRKGALTLHMDSRLRDRAVTLFELLGLDISTATALFYRQALQYGGMPFSLRLDYDHYEVPGEETLETIEEAERGENLAGPFNTVEELFADLNAP